MKAGESLTHNSCYLENDFCRAFWTFKGKVTPTQFPNIKILYKNLTYLVLFPYMEIIITHTAYFQFHLF